MLPRRPVWPFWLLLAVPAAAVTAQALAVEADLDALTARSGEFAAYLLAAALAVTPLLRLFPANRGLVWLRRRRRAIGLAAFGTGVVHLGLYVAAMGNLDDIRAEWLAPGIWTGWAALLLLLPLALTSTDAALRRLRRSWRRLHRLAYPAAVLALAHWALVHDGARLALGLGLPLLALQLTRLLPLRRLA